jgi:hypothetical protein
MNFVQMVEAQEYLSKSTDTSTELTATNRIQNSSSGKSTESILGWNYRSIDRLVLGLDNF